MSLLVSVTDKIVSTAERSFGTRALASKRLVMLFESTAFLRTLFPLSFPPAVVEDIKWDPPMQAPANRIPGPMLRRSVDDAITRLRLLPVSAAFPR